VILMILPGMMYLSFKQCIIYSVVCISSYHMVNVVWNLDIAMILYVTVTSFL
jgi:hypothetical protein